MSAAMPSPAAVGAAPAADRTRVLLVDDAVDTLEAFGYLLELEGAKVTLARSGIEALEQAVAAGDSIAPANLVALHLEAGRLDQALETAERHVDETRPDTLVALGDVRVAQGRGTEAEHLYVQAIRLGAGRAHTAYAYYLAGNGDLAGAEREFRAAVEEGEPRWAVTLARFLLDAGRLDEARGYLQVAIDAGDVEAAELLAELEGDPADD